MYIYKLICNTLFLGQKRGKRRWIFKKQHQETVIQHCCEALKISSINSANVTATKCAVTKPTNNNSHVYLHDDDDHALAVAMATTRAAKAAVVTAQAAVEAIRLIRPNNNYPSIFKGSEHFSAIAIQTAFRGYLVYIPI